MLNVGVLSYILNENPTRTLIGIVMYILVALVGFASNHRTFTHSFLALVLSSIAISLIYLPFENAYVIGYLSHLGLDLLNKKKVPLLFPKGKGICLGWCYANKTANTIFMILGFIATPIIVIFSLCYK